MFDKALFGALCDKYNVERTSEFSKPMLDVDGKVFPITQESVRRLFNIFEAYSIVYNEYDGERLEKLKEYDFCDDCLIA